MSYPVSAIPTRMGRPPMSVKATVVRLPEGVAERIDAIAGKHRRAEFIREAVELGLVRREKSGTQPNTARRR